MSDVATRLKYARARLFGTATETIPVPFTLTCTCGKQLDGIRKATWQQKQCAACNELHFVLPVNVYPTSRRVPSLVLDGPLLQRLKVVVAEFFAARDAETESKPRSRSAAPARLKDYAPPQFTPETIPGDSVEAVESAPTEAREKETAVKAVAEAPLKFSRKTSRAVRQRIVTPFRLLLLASMMVAIGTAWWITHQNRLETARNLWRTSMDGVETALESLAFTELKSHLEDAAAAARLLNRRDGDVLAVENLLRQTEAVTTLSRFDLLQEVEELSSQNPTDRASSIGTLGRALQGEWFLLECGVKPSSNQPGAAELLLPGAVAGLSVKYLVASDWLLAAQETMPDQPLLFAASVERVESTSTNNAALEIRFDPNSLALMTDAAVVNDVGLSVESEDQQSRLLRQEEFVRADRTSSTCSPS
jgi:hypothetical protein